MNKISYLLMAGLLFLTSACANPIHNLKWDKSSVAGLEIGYDEGAFRYFVASDEPYATLIGNQVMRMGGNSMDATVAMAMTMTATMPTRTSLGAGGSCQAILPTGGGLTPMAISFDGRTPQASLSATLYQLHQSYGNISWSHVMAPAEKLLRIGFQGNGAINLIGDNPIWQKQDDLIYAPNLADSLSRLRQKPLAFLYGNKENSMNQQYRLHGLRADDSSAKPKIMTFDDNFKNETINGTTILMSPKNKNLRSGEKRWGQYLASLLGENPKKKPNRLGYDDGVTTMAVDNNGLAVACHFSLNSGTAPVVIEDLGFYAPSSPVNSRSGSVLINFNNQILGMMSIGQSSRGIICANNLTDNAWAEGSNCQWILDEDRRGLSMIGYR